MQELVKNSLNLLGYTMTEKDDGLLSLLTDKVISYVKIECNISKITEEMQGIIADIVIGEFLQHKKTFSKDDLQGIDLVGTGTVASISIGDTSTSFSSANAKTDEQRLDEYINYLLSRKSQLVRFRKVLW